MRKILVLTGLVSAVVLGAAGVAQAQAFDPEAAATTLAGSAVSEMGPIVIAIATAVLGLAVLAWGVRTVFRAISSGGRQV